MKQRIFYFDVLKGIAALSVVLIHVAYLFYLDPLQPESHAGAIIINNLFRFAVPFFLIISGVLLQSPTQKEGWSTFYTRKLTRIFLPYALVSLGYWIVRGVAPAEWPWLFITGNTLEPYYFFSILLQLYFVYPFIRTIKSSPAVQVTTVIIGLLGFTLGLQRVFGIPFFAPYLPYFAFGVYLSSSIRNNHWPSEYKQYALGLILLHIVYFFLFPTYLYNLVYLYALAWFGFFAVTRTTWEQKTSAHRLLAWVGKNSLWFYLAHFSIVKFFYEFLGERFSADQWPVSLLVIFLTSTLVTTAMVAPLSRSTRHLPTSLGERN